MSMMEYLLEMNSRFLADVLTASQFDNRTISAIPSVLFLIFSFTVIYCILHRRTNYLTSNKLRFYREIGFQWTHFYVMRIWFLIVKGFRWLSKYFDEYFETQLTDYDRQWINSRFVHGVLFFFLLFLSLVPFIILVLNCLHKQNIPNFLMWVEEDPWLRSEIGMSGHYLDRPPNFYIPRRKEYAYRSRRSTSVENTNPKIPMPIIRNCRSMEAFVYTQTIEEM